LPDCSWNRRTWGVAFGGVLALAGEVRIQLERKLTGGGAGLAERHPRGRLGQRRVRGGRVGVGQVAGFLLDQPQLERVDQPGAQRGEQRRETGGDGRGVGHLPGRGRLAHMQLERQLIGGELAVQTGTRAAGELRHRRQHQPLVAGPLPPRARQHAQQLIIGTARQARAVVPGDGVHDGGQEGAGGHGAGGAALAEPGQGQLPGRKGDEVNCMQLR